MYRKSAITLSKLLRVSTDGAPSMIGRTAGIVVTNLTPNSRDFWKAKQYHVSLKLVMFSSAVREIIYILNCQ